MGLFQKAITKIWKFFLLGFLWIPRKTGRQNWRGAIFLKFELIEEQCAIIFSIYIYIYICNFIFFSYRTKASRAGQIIHQSNDKISILEFEKHIETQQKWIGWPFKGIYLGRKKNFKNMRQKYWILL